MISFTNLRLLSESIRQGLPSIENMKHEDFANLIHNKKVPIHSVTEKTDGSTFKFGHDENGFYSQSSGSGSEKMRNPEDYRNRVDRRAKETGQQPDYTGADAFAKAHAALQRNQRLLDYLRSHYEQHGTAEVRGELFSHHLARPSDTKEGEVKLVGTSYDPKRWGQTGQVVIHSKLPENEKHDTEHFKRNISNSDLNFEDDKVEHEPSHVDVSEEHADFHKLNHDLIKSRTTKSNKVAKEIELAKLKAIQKRVSDKVDAHVRGLGIKPKFGSGTEGLVVHPKPGSRTPRYKITSQAFRQHKATTSREDFKKRLQRPGQSFSTNEEYSLITEGGNIKVKTPEGEVAAAPFKIKNRAEQTSRIRQALQDIHNTFYTQHREHLFGKNAAALNNGSIYGGSTRDFMNRVNVPDEEFIKYKPAVGDIDVQVSHKHKNKLASVLTPGTRYGPYTVVGTKKHGNEISAVMRHDNGEHHQFDFEGVDTDKNGPTRASQFLHSSNWEDTKKGIKGSHHKILINAIGGDIHKFSITHGLRSRTDETDPGVKNPEEVSSRLFGNKADHSKIHSFGGIAELIRDHVAPERHQQIYDKFRDSVSKMKDTDHGPALAHLRNVLGVKDVMKEESEEAHHVHVSFLGAAPFPHEGHHRDIVGSMEKAPHGRRFVGLSGKSQAFTDKEREDIANKQSSGRVEFKVEKTAGQTVGRAYNSVADRSGRKVLHLHFGHDRKAFAEGLKKSIEAGKIPEMDGGRFHEVHIHYPEDTGRSHGLSGTKMRKAAHEGDLEEFHRHIGPNFTRGEARKLMHKVKRGISSGSIPLLREEITRKDFGPMLTSFVDFASNKLGIKSMPNVRYKDESDNYNSFAAYNPSKNELSVQTKNRHPMDVMRSVAHELVHHWQNENGKIGKDIEKEGSTGSPQENEANAVAGKIMRWFAKANPDAFAMTHIVEQKEAIFVVGGPCSGKDAVIKILKESFDLTEMDINLLSKTIPTEEKVIINAPAHDFESIRASNDLLKKLNYETSLIFVDVENNISKLRNEQRLAKGQRVINESIRFEKHRQSASNKERFRDLFEGKMEIIENNIVEAKKSTGKLKDACWKGYTAYKLKTKNGRKVPDCVPVNEMDKKFEKHMADDKIGTAAVHVNPTSLYEKKKKKKFVKKVLAQEAENGSRLTNAAGSVQLPVTDSLGAEFSVAKSPSIISGLTGVTPVSQGATAIYPFGTYGIAESVINWMNKSETQEKFFRKYGNLAEQKLIETAREISESIGEESARQPKHFNHLRENWEAIGGRDSGTVPKQGKEEVSEDWSDAKHQDPRGGLKASGVRAYRRENPGSKLKTAVRTPPSKLKKGGKRWKRRKSFCARMSGMKKRLTSAKTANDPNSRINKSLRAWNCEE